ncbi:hypothetical protein MCOR25_010395 [Pyricularia grisea]|nr:hypothetical protein MCOR25_010395 [Pyricularia grisea]
MEHLLYLLEGNSEPADPQQSTSIGNGTLYGPNASRCASIENHTVYKRVQELCLPPFFTRKIDYEETGTIRPERPEFRKIESLPSNEYWVNTILKISKAILRHPSAKYTRGNPPVESSPSFVLPFYSGYDTHETGQLLDQAMDRLIGDRPDDFFSSAMSQAMCNARVTMRGVSAILYQHEMINDICKTELPKYTAEPPPPSWDAEWCPTSRLDEIALRIEESPLLNSRCKLLPKVMEIALSHMLLQDYEVDGEVEIPAESDFITENMGYLIPVESGVIPEDMGHLHQLLDDAIAFARTFPYATIEARHLSTGFATFVMEINRFCTETWYHATVIFEDVLHMFFAMRTAIYGGRRRPIVRDLIIAATASGAGEDEETDPGVTNPERAMRARIALQRRLSVDFNVMADFIIEDDVLHHLVLDVIEGVANMMSLPINASDINPGPRKLLETGPEDTDNDLRKADLDNVSIKPAELLSLWELW